MSGSELYIFVSSSPAFNSDSNYKMEVSLAGDYGRIWITKPDISSEGLISTFSLPSDAYITAAAFSGGAENMILVDSKGMVHVLKLKR